MEALQIEVVRLQVLRSLLLELALLAGPERHLQRVGNALATSLWIANTSSSVRS